MYFFVNYVPSAFKVKAPSSVLIKGENEYRYRFWYQYRRKFMVSAWYRIEAKKAGIAHP